MNHPLPLRSPLRLALATVLVVAAAAAAQPATDATDLAPCTVADDLPPDIRVERATDHLVVEWPGSAADERCSIIFALRKTQPLIDALSLNGKAILSHVDPAGVLTVGTRDLAPAGWIIFFDNPRTRPYEAHALTLSRDAIRVVKENGRATVIVDGAAAGPFAGEMHFTVYPGSRLVRASMVMSTQRRATAYLFDAGLTVRSDQPSPWRSIAYTDLHDTIVRSDASGDATSPQVRSRTILAEGPQGGAVAIVPPPHQYFYPLDYANNYATVWLGKDYRTPHDTRGFGVRQTIDGDKRWVPWVNAPEGSRQEMSVFYLLGDGDASQTTQQVLAYTHGDAFKPIDGYQTFTSHYHVEHTVDLLNQQHASHSTTVPADLVEPQFVKRMKGMGINIMHLAEFHLGEGDMKVADRLTRLRTLHAECERLSTDRFLLLPGEEPNVHLGGHWISLFPKPIYWTLDRRQGQPFVEQNEQLGTVYHVGNSDDVLRLMQTEHGLMWTAHPRIKASTGFPDVYKNKDYFKSDRYLGGAWKAMPSDYSLPRLGTRVLDLLDDMNNWAANPSERKQAPGEVDIFAINNDSEVYAHMNVNYLRMGDAVPTFRDGWQPVLDSLRGGAFFTTTGEVLIPRFTIDGKESGQTLSNLTGPSTLHATLDWTFPLSYAEIVSGDGEHVFRQHIDLSDTPPFGTRQLNESIDLRGRKWVRFEVWDAATNGAYTEPVWIE